MSDSVARIRLLELLPGVIADAEQFLTSQAEFCLPDGMYGRLCLVAGYLANLGLKPDGDLLVTEYKRNVLGTGLHMEAHPELYESKEEIEFVRSCIFKTFSRTLESLRRLLQMVSGSPAPGNATSDSS